MRRILTLACAVATLALPAMAAERGRMIGDGTNLPREYVASKDHNTRRAEIVQWIMERGGTSGRNCNAKEKYCATLWTVNLIGGGDLSVMLFRYPADSSKDYSTYCRKAPTGDTNLCYRFETLTYFSKMRDSASGEWVEIWNERNNSGGATPKAASNTDSLL